MPVLNSKLIRDLRKAEGLTQIELLNRCDIQSKRTIQKAEAGKDVAARVFRSLAAGLRVGPPSLLLAESQVSFHQLLRLPAGGYVLRSAANDDDIRATPAVQAAEQANSLQIMDDDAKLGRQYADFYRVSHTQYREFAKNKSNCPLTVDDLIRAAGAPPNVANGNVELFHWPRAMQTQLTEDQRHIWQFVSGIYPARQADMVGEVWFYSSIHPRPTAEVFHWSRRDLAKHWDKWFPVIGWDFVSERFMTRREIVLLLSWLELALAQWTRMPGMHKQGLHTLAQAFSNTLHKQ